MNTNTVGFIGLGHMGEPMARNLLAAGFPLCVFNRTPTRAAALVKQGAQQAASAAQAAIPGGVVVSMLAHDAALEEIVLGDGTFLEKLGAGGLHISMSTVSPDTSRRLATAHFTAGSLFLSAPVFGRPEAAVARKLWICQSGSTAAKDRARAILDALGQGIHDFGEDPGAANVVKLVGNFLIMAAIEAIGEACALAEKSGIERNALTAFFGETIFSCPIYQNYGRIVAGRNFEPAGFKLELGMKDARLVRSTAESTETPMPIADLLHARFLSALAKGRGDLDWTALELSIAEDAGLDTSR